MEITTLKIDVVFKKFFTDTDNRDLLRHFISAVLGIPYEDISDMVISNSEITPDEIDGKFTRFDVNMTVNSMYVNIEIQVSNKGHFRERSLYYWAQNYTKQLKKGDTYNDIKPTISINILDFSLFDTKDYCSEYTMADLEHNAVLTDKCEMHFFELPKLDKTLDINDKRKLWMQLISAESEEELDMLDQTAVPEIMSGVNVIRRFSADDELRFLAQRREKARRDEISALSNAEDKGLKKGLAKGIKQGIKQGMEKGIKQGMEKGIKQGSEKERAEMIASMKQSGMTEEQINRVLFYRQLGN